MKIVPYKGTTVTRLNRDIVDELIYERIAVEARVLRDFAPHCTPEHRASSASVPPPTTSWPRPKRWTSTVSMSRYPAPRNVVLRHGQDVPLADAAERPRRLQPLPDAGHSDHRRLAEVVADHHNLIDAIERCDLAAFEPLVERHLYGGIRRLGSKLTEEYADYFE